MMSHVVTLQAHIEPPPIPLIKEESDDVIKCDIIKIKMCCKPSNELLPLSNIILKF